MKISKFNLIGMAIGTIIAALAFFLFKESNSNIFIFLLALALSIVVFPFIIQIMIESRRKEETNEMFLEFSRNLAESVSTGTPVSKSIVNMRNKNYGPLTPFIVKLANQISLGIPVSKALQNFAYETDNPTIKRAITLIREAEKSGGEIDYILESSARSIALVEKLKKEKKAATSSIVVEGYIIFYIFIAIMLVMQFAILPLVLNEDFASGFSLSGGGGDFISNVGNEAVETQEVQLIKAEELANPLLALLMAQGMLAGLFIGKLTEGSIKFGAKHSFVLAASALLIATGARVLFGLSSVSPS